MQRNDKTGKSLFDNFSITLLFIDQNEQANIAVSSSSNNITVKSKQEIATDNQ
jgi:hypothetical protein